jgi:hypothetical protein
VFKDIRAGHTHVLAVDAGDLLGWNPEIRRSRTLLDAFQRLQYDAVGVGDNEFVEGAAFFAEAVRGRGLPVVSSNVEASVPDWRRVCPPYRIVRKGKLRIGVVGLASPPSFRLLTPARLGELAVGDPEETLRRLLPGVRKQADLIVVLSHADMDWNRGLARRFPDIGVIVGSHSQTRLQAPVREGNTLIVQAGYNGAYVGQLVLTLDRTHRIKEHTGRLIPLGDPIPDDPDMRRLLSDYSGALYEEARRNAALTGNKPSFRGAETCKPCHEAQYQQWRTTAHARAFHSLVEQDKHYEPECLGCHTTGYGLPGGFQDIEATRHLADVQCEVCHRVAEDHSQPSARRDPPAPVLSTLCNACHTPSQSPSFHYEEAVIQVRH